MLETLSVHPRICERIRSPGASTRRARSAGMFKPPRSSAIGWISRTSRRRTSMRRWSVGCQRVVPATVLDAPERPAVGCGWRRPSADCTPVGTGSGSAPPAGRRPMRHRPVVGALQRSPRACARPGRRDPADISALCRSPSCRVRGNADARLVPAHRADDRGVRADPGQPAPPVGLSGARHRDPGVSSLPRHQRRRSRPYRGCCADHPRMEAREPAPCPRG